MRHLALVLLALSALACARAPASAAEPAARTRKSRQLDELSALWSAYKFHFVEDGRVVMRDQDGLTTSEGQSYALLRAVWANDPWAFRDVWRWTRQHLQVRPGDKLLAWKWKGKVLDANSATDADVDVALALLLAARRFDEPSYKDEALALLDDIWKHDVVHVGGKHYVSAGSWAPHERYPVLHVAYLAPYAYQVFAGVDARHPWGALVQSSYEVLHWVFLTQGARFAPETIVLDGKTGQLALHAPGGRPADFTYDSVPLPWRLAVDAEWFDRGEELLRQRVALAFQEEWRARGKLVDRYTTSGKPLSELEGWPHTATAHALLRVEDPELAETVRAERLDGLWENALAGRATPYYLHNWLWFDRALELGAVRHYDEFLGFLRPFDWEGFQGAFPWALFTATLVLAPFARRSRYVKWAFLACAFAIGLRYLGWRAASTLNFRETLGPVISVVLLLAELYSFSTVALLVLQVGTRTAKGPEKLPQMPSPLPSVDIFIPIYSEGLDVLDKTLTAAQAMRYPNKRIYVCDDSHRDAVRALAEEHGATYVQGPKRHAKAGNINNALKHSSGELLLIFDTDHMPVATFLDETVPYFSDPKVGFLQTPHHFYNQDIFQRALKAGPAVPNEQDMFNHPIQAGRNGWGGAFFVGSGALFRRTAMEGVGGLKLLSITEDIHTSQHLHAAGWKSAFVDKDLAVGLSAENLAGYVVQRRRWMLGCLQIFFKDNPLFLKGLPWRHRLGYFASLYYFFFPLARVVFWSTPLLYLLFHLHPLFADVSVLMGHLVPYMVVLPLATRVLLPGYPRAFWGDLYELLVSFTLVRAMADLVLPAALGFKVTPKGVTSTRRSFDVSSSRLTLVAVAISLVAIGKGLFEFHYFGIEKDAYFFNLAWACLNLVALLAALLVAWEAPQRRTEERLRREVPVELVAPGLSLRLGTWDVSLSGVGFRQPAQLALPDEAELRFEGGPTLRVRRVYQEREGRRWRFAYQYVEPTTADTRALVRLLFSDPEPWARAHAGHTRSALVLAFHFWRGVVATFLPERPRRRSAPRTRTFGRFSLVLPGGARSLYLHDRSEGGLGLTLFGRPLPPPTAPLPVLAPGQPVRFARLAYQRRRLPGVWRVGLQFVDVGATPASHPEESQHHVYLAAA